MKKILFGIGILISIILFFQGCFVLSDFVPSVSDYDIKLPNEYSVIKASSESILLCKDNISIISHKISRLAYDDNYIQVEQQKFRKKDDGTYDAKMLYWIVNHKTDKIYGPLSEKDFIEKKKELSISDKVELKNLSKFDRDYGD